MDDCRAVVAFVIYIQRDTDNAIRGFALFFNKVNPKSKSNAGAKYCFRWLMYQHIECGL